MAVINLTSGQPYCFVFGLSSVPAGNDGYYAAGQASGSGTGSYGSLSTTGYDLTTASLSLSDEVSYRPTFKTFIDEVLDIDNSTVSSGVWYFYSRSGGAMYVTSWRGNSGASGTLTKVSVYVGAQLGAGAAEMICVVRETDTSGSVLGSATGAIGGANGWVDFVFESAPPTPTPSSGDSLLHLDGDNGSKTITDSGSSGLSWTCSTYAELTTAEKKWGSASLQSGGVYATSDVVGAFSLVGDFGIDFQAKPIGDSIQIEGNYNASFVFWRITCSNSAVHFYGANYGGGTTQLYHEFLAELTEWNHIAVMRKNGLLAIFLDGVMIASTVSNSSFYGTDAEGVTRYITVNAGAGSYVDEVRFVFGDCPADDEADRLYIASGDLSDGFTAPAGPHGETTYVTVDLTFGIARDQFAETDNLLGMERDQEWYRVTTPQGMSRDHFAETSRMVGIHRDQFADTDHLVGVYRDIQWPLVTIPVGSYRDQFAEIESPVGIYRDQNWFLVDHPVGIYRDQFTDGAEVVFGLSRDQYAETDIPVGIHRDQLWFTVDFGVGVRRDHHCETGVLLILRNADTFAEIDREFLDDATTEWVRAELDEGNYLLEVRPQRYAWKDCRATMMVHLAVGADGAVSGLLPRPEDLSISYVGGDTRIAYTVFPGPQTDSVDRIAAWFSSSYPIDTSGAPDSIIYMRGMTAAGRRAFLRTQTGAEYCAIRTGDGTSWSQPGEIAMPDIGSVGGSPVRQLAEVGA